MQDTSLIDFLAPTDATPDEFRTIFGSKGYLNKSEDSLKRLNEDVAKVEKFHELCLCMEEERHANALARIAATRRRDMDRALSERETRLEACFNHMVKALRKGFPLKDRYW